MAPVLIVPGWRNSGPDHWQTLWQARLPHAVRVAQDDWLLPTRHGPWPVGWGLLMGLKSDDSSSESRPV